MRTLAVFFVAPLLAVSLGGACAAQDAAAGYQGPYLNWSGKVAAPAAPQPSEPAPEPQTAPPPSAPAEYRSAPAVFNPSPSPRPSSYSQESAAPAPAASSQAAPAPAALAQNPSPPPYSSAPVRVRFYSLHRAYGLRPDPIAMPKRRPYVLIGPPDNPAASDSTARNQQGSGDGQKSGKGGQNSDD